MPTSPMPLDFGPLLPYHLEELFVWLLIGLPVLGLVIWLIRTEIRTRQARELIAAQERLLIQGGQPENAWEPEGWVAPETEPQQSPYGQEPSR